MPRSVCTRSLPLALWPATDRNTWLARQERYRRGGTRHFAEVTRKDLERRYSYFLDFVRNTSGFDSSLPAAGHVTPESVEAYIARLKAMVGSVTAERNIHKLRRVAQILASKRDWEWLKDLEAELAFAAIPKAKFDRIVDPHRILAAGLAIVKEAETTEGLRPTWRALRYRNGLMVALLSVVVIRLKNYAALELDRTIKKIGTHWWIALPAREAKGRRADERRIHRLLKPCLDRYIDHYRPQLGPTNKLLWVGEKGQPLKYKTVGRLITETTREVLGVPISPHLFRACAASYVAIAVGKQHGLASALLQHTHPQTTEKHYNLARMATAAEEFGRLIEE
jgi:integrase/recombinase XerD